MVIEGFFQIHLTPFGLVSNLVTVSMKMKYNVEFGDMLSTVVIIKATDTEFWIRMVVSSKSIIHFMLDKAS